MATIPIFYSLATGRVRRWTKPTFKNEVLNAKPLDGEGVLEVDEKNFGDLFHLQNLVTQATGLIPSGDRYAIVDVTGAVVGAVIADPACGDAIPSKTLIAHDEAVEGWTFDAVNGFRDFRPVGISKIPIVDIP